MNIIPWLRKKAEPVPAPEYTITSVEKAGKGGWLIEYGDANDQFMSVIFRVFMNGEVRPAPEVGDTVKRVFVHGSGFLPPCHELKIRGHWYKHYAPDVVGITVEGVI